MGDLFEKIKSKFNKENNKEEAVEVSNEEQEKIDSEAVKTFVFDWLEVLWLLYALLLFSELTQ